MLESQFAIPEGTDWTRQPIRDRDKPSDDIGATNPSGSRRNDACALTGGIDACTARPSRGSSPDPRHRKADTGERLSDSAPTDIRTTDNVQTVKREECEAIKDLSGRSILFIGPFRRVQREERARGL